MTEAVAAPADAPGAAAPASAAAPTTTLLTAADTPSPAAGTQAADAAAATTEADAETTDAKSTDEAAKPPERAAPEKYEFKAAEGQALDAELMVEFEGVARELGMPQAEAQAMVDRLAPKIAERVAAQQAQAIEQAATDWAAATTADKEIGGDKLAANLGLAKKALDAFGTPELRGLLNDSRFGNHPEVVRFMVRAGKAISEEKFVAGGNPPAGAGRSLADVLYPTQH